jgi:hypothetical protein
MASGPVAVVASYTTISLVLSRRCDSTHRFANVPDIRVEYECSKVVFEP